jgi:hypothetical protein
MKITKALLEKKPLLEIILMMFGLLATVLLGLMAVVLTRAANLISESQLQLAERQTALAEIELQPRFRFNLNTLLDHHDQHHLMKIYNDGTPIESFEVRHFEFLEIDRGDYNLADRRLVPTYYFGDHKSTGDTHGLLFTMTSLWSDNYKAPQNATRVFKELAEALQAPSASQAARVRMFVALYYMDVAGTYHEVSY